MDSSFADDKDRLDDKIDRLRGHMDSSFDNEKHKLDAKIDRLAQHFANVTSKLNIPTEEDTTANETKVETAIDRIAKHDQLRGIPKNYYSSQDFKSDTTTSSAASKSISGKDSDTTSLSRSGSNSDENEEDVAFMMNCVHHAIDEIKTSVDDEKDRLEAKIDRLDQHFCDQQAIDEKRVLDSMYKNEQRRDTHDARLLKIYQDFIAPKETFQVGDVAKITKIWRFDEAIVVITQICNPPIFDRSLSPRDTFFNTPLDVVIGQRMFNGDFTEQLFDSRMLTKISPTEVPEKLMRTFEIWLHLDIFSKGDMVCWKENMRNFRMLHGDNYGKFIVIDVLKDPVKWPMGAPLQESLDLVLMCLSNNDQAMLVQCDSRRVKKLTKQEENNLHKHDDKHVTYLSKHDMMRQMINQTNLNPKCAKYLREMLKHFEPFENQTHTIQHVRDEFDKFETNQSFYLMFYHMRLDIAMTLTEEFADKTVFSTPTAEI